MDALESEPIPLGPPVLPWKLFGTDRAAAHVAVSQALDLGHPYGDKQVLEWVRRDASLFVEPLPRSNRREADFAGIPNIGFQGRLYGTWLQRAGGELYVETVMAALDAGVHPDDARVFRGGSLMWAGDWALDAQRIRLAVERGADVNKHSTEGGVERTLVRQAIYRLRTAMHYFITGDYRSHHEFVSSTGCLRTLLQMGAKGLDPVARVDDGNPVWRGESQDRKDTAVGQLLEHSNRIDQESDLLEELAGVVRMLHEHGADIDRRTGVNLQPPVVTAACHYNEWALNLLIDLGARTDDEHLLRVEAGQKGAKSFIEGLRGATGDESLVARVTARLMRRTISGAQASGGEQGGSDAKPRRRRAAV